MDAFDIGRLTDFDFEAVCKDLFEIVLGLRLEIFAPGRDSGIDLRHMSSPTSGVHDVVIQCKHWERSKFSTLYNHIKNKELPKIRSLNPSRYILATSVTMSVQQKARLLKLLAPYVKSAHAQRLGAAVPEIAIPAGLARQARTDRLARVEAACDLVLRIRDSGAFAGVHLIPVARYREVAARLEQRLADSPAP